ncbi:polysaccharide biosynthesis C-terminal domain-containing protein, partial [Candidatus Aerophobetes bacterium]|nr:polysaccharide biosynthesis C-terminal domain-containing protein [Candidatus Aerophobetes bacterium]
RKTLISLLFEHGAFLAQDSLMTGQALFYYALGLLAMGEVMVLNRAFYSLQEILVPVKVSLFVLFLNVLLNFLLISPLKHSGLALATSISMISNMIILFVLLRIRIRGLEGKIILASFLKTCLISILMAGAVYLVLEGIPSFVWISGMVSEIIQLCAAVGAGGLVFFLLTYLFRMEELKIVLSVLRGKK